MFKQRIAKYVPVGVGILFLGWILGWLVLSIRSNAIIAGGDTYFHVQRIYEVREAFAQHMIPTMFNWDTFHSTGQAVNAMYPDLTMWPFVFVTMWASPLHQIFYIQALILIFSFGVTFMVGRSRFGATNAALFALTISLSGKMLSTISDHLQPSPELAMIAIFPVVLLLIDLLEKPEDNQQILLKLALWGAWMFNSHVLSTIIMAIIAGSVVIVTFVRSSEKRSMLKRIGLAAVVGLGLCLPMIYRMMIGFSTGVLPPATVDLYTSSLRTMQALFLEATDTSDLPLIAFAFFALVGVYRIRGEAQGPIVKFLALTIGVLLILSTKIFPWMLFNQVPIFSQFQSPTTRILPFVFPILLILVGVILVQRGMPMQTWLLVGLISFVFSYATATVVQYQRSGKPMPLVNKTVIEQKQATLQEPQGTPSRLTNEAITAGYNEGVFFDYAPKKSGLVPRGSWAPSDLVFATAQHKGLVNGKETQFELKQHQVFGIQLITTAKKGEQVELPVWMYHYKYYAVRVNGKSMTIGQSVQGRMQYTAQQNGRQQIEVREQTSPVYVGLLLTMFVTLGGAIWYLRKQK